MGEYRYVEFDLSIYDRKQPLWAAIFDGLATLLFLACVELITRWARLGKRWRRFFGRFS